MNWPTRYSAHSSTILRLGLIALFTWFGLTQLLAPAMWTGFVPGWLADLTGLSVTKLVLVNGALELLAAFLLTLGVWLPLVALLLCVHLFGIVFQVGLTPVGVRDLMIALAALALAVSSDTSSSRQS